MYFDLHKFTFIYFNFLPSIFPSIFHLLLSVLPFSFVPEISFTFNPSNLLIYFAPKFCLSKDLPNLPFKFALQFCPSSFPS